MSSPVVMPACGRSNTTVDDGLWKYILLVFALIGAISGLLATPAFVAWLLGLGVVCFAGLCVTGGALLGAGGGALAVLGFVVYSYWNRCTGPANAGEQCTAGIVETIIESFSSATDVVFPFVAMHDRVDVVVAPLYWDVVSTGAGSIDCSPAGSPMIHCFYHSDEVCNAGLGAIVGGVAGAVVGTVLGAAAAAALCTTAILCVLGLLLGFLIAAAVTAAGASIGGQVGRAASGSNAPAGASGPSTATIRVGDIVSVRGPVATIGFLDGARGYWFVTGTVIHDRSSSNPSYTWQQADAETPQDACFLIE